jgi:hypothetical protein
VEGKKDRSVVLTSSEKPGIMSGFGGERRSKMCAQSARFISGFRNNYLRFPRRVPIRNELLHPIFAASS